VELGDLTIGDEASATLAVATLLDRLNALDSQRDAALFATLERRAFGAAARAELTWTLRAAQQARQQSRPSRPSRSKPWRRCTSGFRTGARPRGR
jgi:hypothetical protein